MMAELTDNELLCLFPDIAEFRRQGLLRGDSPVRDLDAKFRAACNTDNSMLRQVEDAVLYEMARRYNNALETGAYASSDAQDQDR